jgi:hypothetical protein
MKARCSNPNGQYYHRYGGRGIAVCERWQTFESFYEDMGDPPSGHSIDRIDNDLGYFKANCRWATKKIQANNTSSNRYLTIEGETKTASQWCELLGVNRKSFYTRLSRGHSIASALRLHTVENPPPGIGGHIRARAG